MKLMSHRVQKEESEICYFNEITSLLADEIHNFVLSLSRHVCITKYHLDSTPSRVAVQSFMNVVMQTGG